MEKCPCGSDSSFSDCCGPIIKGTKLPLTAEACMRSRYSAYVKGDIEYIKTTFNPSEVDQFNVEETKAWSEHSDWKGLQIVEVEKGGEKDSEGVVEFIASYAIKGTQYDHHERSTFEKIDGKWYFMDGKTMNTPIKREAPKVGRNDPCPCGSGKKFKKCCL